MSTYVYDLATHESIDVDHPNEPRNEHFEHYLHASHWHAGTGPPPHPGRWADCDLHHVGDELRGRPGKRDVPR